MIEIVFGTGLGDMRRSAQSTVLAYRGHEEPPETSLRAFAAGLHERLAGMARDCSTFVLAPEGERFYFLLLVHRPTLGLDVAQTVTFTVDRTRRVTIREQMAGAAASIACRLADLGTPAWLAPHEPRVPARLDAASLLH